MKIAIVGGGIAGLTAAWLLDEHHQVTVFERNNYFGGNWVTLNVKHGDHEIPVAPGVAAVSNYYYYTLFKLFESLNIEHELIKCDPPCFYNRLTIKYPYKNLEISESSRLKNMMMGMYTLQMLRDGKELIETNDNSVSINDFIIKYPKYNTEIFIQFLFSILHILGVKPDSGGYLKTPVLFMLKVMDEFRIKNVYSIKLFEFKSGPAAIIKTIMSHCSHTKFSHSTEVSHIQEKNNHLLVSFSSDGKTSTEEFDMAILAVHPPDILKMMPTIYCRDLLADLLYTKVQSVIHGDDRVMPSEKNKWPNFNSIFMPFFDIWVDSGWLGINREIKNIFCTYAWNDLTADTSLFRDLYHKMWFEYPHISPNAIKIHDYLKKDSLRGPVAIIGYWTEGIFTSEDAIRSAFRIVSQIDPKLATSSVRYQSLHNANSKIPKQQFGHQIYEGFLDHVMRPMYFKLVEPLIHKILTT